MNNVFNTPHEMSLRILLLLDESTLYPLDQERIVAFDFIASYGVDFDVSEYNLHGDNINRFSELSSRKELVGLAIKELVLKGLISVDTTDGFRYSITDEGSVYIGNIYNSYAELYRSNVLKAIQLYGNMSSIDITSMINERASHKWEEKCFTSKN